MRSMALCSYTSQRAHSAQDAPLVVGRLSSSSYMQRVVYFHSHNNQLYLVPKTKDVVLSDSQQAE